MDPAYIEQYEQFEVRHWWYRARREIIESFLSRYVLSKNSDPRWLDVGCGTGVLLESYRAIGRKVGIEIDAGSVERGRRKGLDLRPTPPEWDFSSLGEFDVITLCDVIEHVEHEQQALEAVYQALRPGGTVLVTVPALMSLWSDHDVVNHHFRRYNHRQLRKLFTSDRWEIIKSSYFCSFLFPAVYAVRKLKNLTKHNGSAAPAHDFKFGPRVVDAMLYRTFRAERHLLHAAKLPIGSSLILVARKRA